MKRWALLWGILLIFSAAASAQEENPKVEVYGGYSLIHNSSNFLSGGINFNGGGGSVSYNPNGWLGLVADFGGNHWSNPFVDANVITYLFGPKIALRNDKFTPFAQVLFGGARISGTAFGVCLAVVGVRPQAACRASGSENAFAMTVGGGLDWNVSKHIGIRPVQAEYLMTRFNALGPSANDTQNSFRYGAGVVFRW